MADRAMPRAQPRRGGKRSADQADGAGERDLDRQSGAQTRGQRARQRAAGAMAVARVDPGAAQGGEDALRADQPVDPRIAKILVALRARPEAGMSAGRLAAAASLSSSRMQHLFSAAMGVPFRRYRAWLRMRRAIEAVLRGANFTGAAHEAAFADQAHFANAFRRTFGVPASYSLQDIRRPIPSRRSGAIAQAGQDEHPQGR